MRQKTTTWVTAISIAVAGCAQGSNESSSLQGAKTGAGAGSPVGSGSGSGALPLGSAAVGGQNPVGGGPSGIGAAAVGAAAAGAAGLGNDVGVAGNTTIAMAGAMAIGGAAGTLPAAGVGAMAGAASDGPPITASGNCAGATIAAVSGDYSKNGPFMTRTINGTGPDGRYTIFTPSSLGQDGFKHPVATWGNGITTDPSFYPALLGAVASHGFVVIASNSTTVTAQLMTAGLDWMIAQNDAPGDFQGKLNPTCLVTLGYSLGGGGAVGAGPHANVVATVSMHGVAGASAALHAPLLLLTAETDTVCTPAAMVTPTFQQSAVQTFYGTISRSGDSSNQGHLIPVDGALSLITLPAANLAERAAVIAWLRLWVYGDEGAKKYFYPDDCILCQAPWTNPQRKNWQ